MLRIRSYERCNTKEVNQIFYKKLDFKRLMVSIMTFLNISLYFNSNLNNIIFQSILYMISFNINFFLKFDKFISLKYIYSLNHYKNMLYVKASMIYFFKKFLLQ